MHLEKGENMNEDGEEYFNGDGEWSGDEGENFFIPDDEKKNTEKNRKEFFVINELVKKRLAMIAAGLGRLTDLQIAEPHAFHPNSIVFNGFYKMKGGEDAAEVFVEISRLKDGFPLTSETIVCVKKNPAVPEKYFFIEDANNANIVFGAVYKKFLGLLDFDSYFFRRQGETIYFLDDLRTLIEQLHCQLILLPPNWSKEGIIFVGPEKQPVFIGYNETKIWRDEKEFYAGCYEDWCEFLGLVADSEKQAPAEFLDMFKELENEIVDKMNRIEQATASQ